MLVGGGFGYARFLQAFGWNRENDNTSECDSGLGITV